MIAACALSLFSTFTGLYLFDRARATVGLLKLSWILAASIVLGLGLSLTSYAALVSLRADLDYAVILRASTTDAALADILIAVGLVISAYGRRVGPKLGGLVTGTAITFSHATSGLTTTAFLSVRYLLVWVIAMILSASALTLVTRRKSLPDHIAAAILLALAMVVTSLALISGFGRAHLAAESDAAFAVHRAAIDIAIVVITLAIIGLGLAIAVLDDFLASRALREAQRLRESEGRFRLLADATFEGIVIHEDGRIRNANAAFCALMSLNPQQIIGADLEIFIPKEFRSRLNRVLDNTGGEPEEMALIVANGDRLPIEILQRNIDFEGHSIGVIAIRDISERKLAAERISYLAHHDTLTGLPNRVLLNELLIPKLRDLDQAHHKIGILHLDLDRFRQTNEIHGAMVGDRVLRTITERLRETLRSQDYAARVGNDEYAVVLNEIDRPEQAAQMAERIIAAIARPIDVAGLDIEISVCIGVAIAPDDGATPEHILRHASLALQRAKEAGKGVIRFFEASMDDRLRARRTLERDLKQAIQHRQIEVHYQPLYSSSKSTLVGFEALARWNHPIHGLIPPTDFIPVAEESGLIILLGQAVLWAACAEAATWAAPLRVAVNLSPAQFRHPGLVDNIRAVLDGTGLGAERLELEVTESVLIEETGHALVTMQRLKKMGIRLALDDFGTGYSSLSYLHRFPFDKIKIDRSFVAALEQDSEAMAIVRAVVAMGHSLHMTVTAEGLETQQQLGFLRELRCDHLQGYLLGKPMAVGKLFDFMEGSQVAAALERGPGAA